MTTETIITDPKTGGQKASKLARFDLIPTDALWALAERYGEGAKKYAENNWLKGYAWGLSYTALQRHLAAWWMGEEIDEPTQQHHLTAVMWHAMALFVFQKRKLGTDDRVKT